MYLLQGNHFNKEDAYFALRDNKLLTLTIMLENFCNFKCPFCYTQTQKFNNELETDEIITMIDDAISVGVKSILIAGAGEPLMAHNFWQIVEYIHKKELYCVIFSNMTKITEDVAKRLFDLNVSIIGKINSFNKTTQNQIVGNIHNAYQKMNSGLNNLLQTGFNKIHNGLTRLAIETSIIPENIHEAFDIWKYCRENNIYPLLDTVLYEGNAKRYNFDNFLVSYDELVLVVKKIHQYDKKLGINWPIKVIKREDNKGIIIGELAGDCHRIGTNLNVNSIGDVYDCFNMSRNSYGNIRKTSINKMCQTNMISDHAIKVHGLCHCRYLTNREQLQKEIACLN